MPKTRDRQPAHYGLRAARDRAAQSERAERQAREERLRDRDMAYRIMLGVPLRGPLPRALGGYAGHARASVSVMR